MGLFSFIARLFGFGPKHGGNACPRCLFSYKWDGRNCDHCGYPGVLRSGSVQSPGMTPPVQSPTTTSAQSSVTVARRAPVQTLSNLDADQFAPMTDADVESQSGGEGFMWGNPWFGRRDLIPPVTDKRTMLIDRAMVGHGLISPDELTQIHKVGEEMDAVRPDLAQAQQIAQRAVEADQAAREQLKQQKKAESEERKRKHEEAVAHRKATDIIFLGRGISRGLADRRANVEKLQSAGLPVLATPGDVAQALDIAIPRLRWLAFHSEAATATHYVRFTIPKKSGGTRELSAPHQSLAQAQEWILQNVLSKVKTHDAAHGFVPGRSTVTNAAPHVGRAVVVNADLKNFFPTINFHRVKGIFQHMGYSPAVATIFASICTESPRRTVTYAGKKFHVALGDPALPQGACTSPALSNLVSRTLDARLTGIAEKLGWTYTRYADDLTFSVDQDGNDKVGYLLARIRHIAQDEGFAVNEKKTRVLRKNARQSVTGIVVNQRAGVPRKTVRRIRAILHQAKHQGLASQNRDKRPHFEAWVRGMVAYISMVNPDQGKPLADALSQVG